VVAGVRRYDDFVQDVHGVEDIRVGHQRQVKEFVDFSGSELRPDPIVLPHYFLASRVHRPIGAAVPQIFESDLHTAVALTQSGVKRHTQICDEARYRERVWYVAPASKADFPPQPCQRSAIHTRPYEISIAKMRSYSPSQASSVNSARAVLRYESAEVYAVELLARLPAMRFNSESRLPSSDDGMR